MHFFLLTTLTAFLASFVVAASPAGHVNTAPYGNPDTYFEGYAEAHPSKNVSLHGPPGHVNKAPYGNPDTFFNGLEEAKNATLHARTSQAGVYWCPGSDWWGAPCFYTIASGGACHSWNYQDTLRSDRLTASFGPDHGIRCSLWAGSNCNEGGHANGVVHGIEYPGTDVIGEILPVTQWSPYSFNCGWI